jgi:hypothetical protein
MVNLGGGFGGPYQQQQTAPYQQHQHQHQHQQQPGVVLTPKPHPFSGAVLPPKHARELTPTLVVSVTAALADAVPRKETGSYTSSSHQPQHSSSSGGRPSHRNQASDSSIGHLLQSHAADIFNQSHKSGEQLQQLPQDELLSTGCVQYTVWITEAWRILGWAEPSAALFWEMATMYHTLFVASRVIPPHDHPSSSSTSNSSTLDGSLKENLNINPYGGSNSNNNHMHPAFLNSPRQQHPHHALGGLSSIPPILSCGSTGSMDSQATSNYKSGPPSPVQSGGKGSASSTQNHSIHSNQGGSHQKANAASAKELPVWLVGFFLLLHTEEHAHARNVSGDDERRFESGMAAGFRGAGGGAGGVGVNGNKSSSASSSTSPFGLEPWGSPPDKNAAAGAGKSPGSLGPRTRLHATTEYDVLHRYLASFWEKHIRKLLLFCAIPQNPDAILALHSMVSMSRDYSRQQQQHPPSVPNSAAQTGVGGDEINNHKDLLEDDANLIHSGIANDVTLSAKDVERLNFILQRPLGGHMDDSPLCVSQVLLEGNGNINDDGGSSGNDMAPTPTASGVGSSPWGATNILTRRMPLGQVEDQLRRHLRAFDMGRRKSDGNMSSDAGLMDHLDDQVSAAMASLSLSSGASTGTAPTPTATMTNNTASQGQGYRDRLPKELLYSGVRGTTILLKPRKHHSHSSNANESSNTGTHGMQGLGPSVPFDSPDLQLYNGQDPPSRLHDVTIVNCSGTHLYLLQPFEHVTISACTDCTIVLGAVAGLLHIQDCERIRITSTSRRIAVSNSLEVVQYCFTPSPPLLVGDNRSCQLAPYNTYYDGLREDLLATGLAAAVMRGDGPSAAGGGSSGGNLASLLTPTDAFAHLGTGGILKYAALTCASNKWKVPVELGKLEVPSLSLPGTSITPSSPNPGADDSASPKRGEHATDDAMTTPILLPASEFQIIFIPLESESMRMRRTQAECVVATATANASGSPEDMMDDRASSEAGESEVLLSDPAFASQPTPQAGNTASTTTKEKEEESQYCRNLTDILHSSPFRLPVEYERRVHMTSERVKTLHAATRSDDLPPEQQAHVEEEMNQKFRDWLVTSGNLRQVLDLVHMEREQAL